MQVQSELYAKKRGTMFLASQKKTAKTLGKYEIRGRKTEISVEDKSERARQSTDFLIQAQIDRR